MEKTDKEQKCCQHKSHLVNMLSLSDSIEQAEICFMCVNQYNLQESELLLIDDLMNSTSDTIVKNYPPMDDPLLQNKLNKLSEDILNLENIKRQAQSNLNGFKSYIQTLITQIEQTITDHFDHLHELKMSLLETYQKLSSINELKQILLEDDEDKWKRVNQMIKEKKGNKNSYTEQISTSVNILTQKIESISANPFPIIQNKINALFNQIDLFSQSQINLNLCQNDKEFPLHGNSKNNNQSMDNNASLIYNLISNKTNYCSKEYLSYVEGQLKKYSHIFNNNSFDISTAYDHIKKATFNQLNEFQLESVRKLSENIIKVSSQYENLMTECSSTDISQSVQPNSFKIYKNLIKFYHYNHLEKDFQQILREYPIFENIYIPKEKSILKEIDFIKSELEHSQKMELVRLSSSQLLITATTYKYALAYANFTLNPSTRYVFRINIQSYINSYELFILFGLIADEDKDLKLLHSEMMSYCERGNEFGMNRIVKGGPLHMNNRQNRNRTFEVRIHLSEKVYRIADYPNYERVCEINDKSRIMENLLYRFAAELCYKDDKITIEDVLEVEQFDNRM